MTAGVAGSSLARIVVCTRNAHKLGELRELLPGWRLDPLPDGVDLPEESGTTFDANAAAKARVLAGGVEDLHAIALADDSGLCVDALSGAPGVMSARFAGSDATDEDNIAKLLDTLADFDDVDERTARFVCALVAVLPDGRELRAIGELSGHIAFESSGDHGFGYDPVFVPAGETRSLAVLGPQAKMVNSHRARAARRMAELLQRELDAVGVAT